MTQTKPTTTRKKVLVGVEDTDTDEWVTVKEAT